MYYMHVTYLVLPGGPCTSSDRHVPLDSLRFAFILQLSVVRALPN